MYKCMEVRGDILQRDVYFSSNDVFLKVEIDTLQIEGKESVKRCHASRGEGCHDSKYWKRQRKERNRMWGYLHRDIDLKGNYIFVKVEGTPCSAGSGKEYHAGRGEGYHEVIIKDYVRLWKGRRPWSQRGDGRLRKWHTSCSINCRG